MAISINVQDLENYPGITKRVSIDLESVVPLTNEGDEQFVLSASTSAYSDNTLRTTIQDLYVIELKTGWCKSSGFAGSSGKFYVDDTHKTMRVRIDATVSGTDGSGYYDITLTPNEDSTPITGEVIAEEMEESIRALAASLNPADSGFYAAYRNASVEYKNGKFWIISGSMSPHYSGNNRTSVVVVSGTTNDCTEVLGFDLPTTSYALSNVAVKETLLNTNYTVGDSTVNVNTGTGASAGKVFMITDGINIDYFTALSGTTDSSIVVPTTAANNYAGIVNNYTANKAKLQLLREQDPESVPTNWYTSIDQLVRFGIKTIANQIDYSS